MTTAKLLSITLIALAALTPPAQAQTPTGTIARLSGWVLVVRGDGQPRTGVAGSLLATGETLATEPGSYAQLRLDDGSELTLGPLTSVTLDPPSPQGAQLTLTTGQLLVLTPARSERGQVLTVKAGASRLLAGPSSFLLNYVPMVDAAVAARWHYLHDSFASAKSTVMSDAGSGLGAGSSVAQAPPRPGPGSGNLAPGLYVHVIDGVINLTNRGGSLNFSAGQFGYTASFTQPPVVLPSNPGLKFTPPPAFSSSSSPATGSGAGASGAVDCEVR